MRLLSTRARAELWKHQAMMRLVADERRKSLKNLLATRNVIVGPAQYEMWQNFMALDQEYRFAIVQLQAFCERHNTKLERRRSASGA